jgi:hypothetical protein
MIDVKNKIVFVHIGKTGGSSITASLLDLQGIKCNGGFFPTSLKEEYKAGHAHAPELKSQLESQGESWDDYYKFTIVRDPYTRLKSHYTFFKYDKKMTFCSYLQDDHGQLTREVPCMYDYLHDEDGNILVDDVYHFEDGFENIYRALENRFNISLRRLHAKDNARNTRKLQLDTEAIRLINDRYDVDFKTFDYQKK